MAPRDWSVLIESYNTSKFYIQNLIFNIISLRYSSFLVQYSLFPNHSVFSVSTAVFQNYRGTTMPRYGLLYFPG